jgi:hypothetical protein
MSVHSAGVVVLVIGSSISAQDSTSATPPPKLALKAEIVLSKEFCATKKRQSIAINNVLKVGNPTCEQLYAALSPVFLDLQRLEKMPDAGSGAAQMVLVPRFVDINATPAGLLPSSQRELIITVEWTVLDSMGHTIWLQTVEGSSRHKSGWVITARAVGDMVNDAVVDLAKGSVTRISTAPELRKLSP